jgi:hypothetical protein
MPGAEACWAFEVGRIYKAHAAMLERPHEIAWRHILVQFPARAGRSHGHLTFGHDDLTWLRIDRPVRDYLLSALRRNHAAARRLD